MAIATRCRCPPEISCGYARAIRSGSGSRTSLERGDAPPRAGRAAQPVPAPQRLGDLPADPHQRVERGQRLLEDDGRGPAAQPVSVALRRPDDLGPGRPGASSTTLPRRGHPGREQTHDRQRGQGLARPDSPISPSRSPASTRERHVARRGRGPPGAHVEPRTSSRLIAVLLRVGSATSRRPSAIRLTPMTSTTSEHAGGDRADRRREHGRLGLLQHAAPRTRSAAARPGRGRTGSPRPARRGRTAAPG